MLQKHSYEDPVVTGLLLVSRRAHKLQSYGPEMDETRSGWRCDHRRYCQHPSHTTQPVCRRTLTSPTCNTLPVDMVGSASMAGTVHEHTPRPLVQKSRIGVGCNHFGERILEPAV